MYHQPLIITGASASQVCYESLRHFTSDDPRNWSQTAPRGLTIRERLAVTYRIDNALACVAWLKRRHLSYPFMAAEFCWMLLGRRDVASISRYCAKIKDFSDDGVIFFGAYGPPFQRQLPFVLSTLRRDPSSRQAVIVIWRESPPSTRDVPCTVSCQFLVRDGELHGIFAMRSSDAWLGLPYDLFNFSRLTAVVAGQLACPVGSLTVTVGSAHLYERDRVRADEVVAAADFRQAGCSPLSLLPDEEAEILNATLDGKVRLWTKQLTLEQFGWYELYAMLRYAGHKDVSQLFGDFSTVLTWEQQL